MEISSWRSKLLCPDVLYLIVEASKSHPKTIWSLEQACPGVTTFLDTSKSYVELYMRKELGLWLLKYHREKVTPSTTTAMSLILDNEDVDLLQLMMTDFKYLFARPIIFDWSIDSMLKKAIQSDMPLMKVIRYFFDKNSMTDDMRDFIFHNGNEEVINFIREELGIKASKENLFQSMIRVEPTIDFTKIIRDVDIPVYKIAMCYGYLTFSSLNGDLYVDKKLKEMIETEGAPLISDPIERSLWFNYWVCEHQVPIEATWKYVHYFNELFGYDIFDGRHNEALYECVTKNDLEGLDYLTDLELEYPLHDELWEYRDEIIRNIQMARMIIPKMEDQQDMWDFEFFDYHGYSLFNNVSESDMEGYDYDYGTETNSDDGYSLFNNVFESDMEGYGYDYGNETNSDGCSSSIASSESFDEDGYSYPVIR